MSYYNTNNETGDTLAESKKKAETQEEVVLAFFKNNPGQRFIPSELGEFVLPGVPLTSVRRALTNLASAGKLVKSPVMQEGSFGKMVHTWRLRDRRDSLFTSNEVG